MVIPGLRVKFYQKFLTSIQIHCLFFFDLLPWWVKVTHFLVLSHSFNLQTNFPFYGFFALLFHWWTLLGTVLEKSLLDGCYLKDAQCIAQCPLSKKPQEELLLSFCIWNGHPSPEQYVCLSCYKHFNFCNLTASELNLRCQNLDLAYLSPLEVFFQLWFIFF